ncbi:hypothetical protein JCM10914A_53250 [Paenibacillus sp. JCM 10914]|uniref:antibiotic biosynthesis monooxygenase family protein n=1 Tax=Paenibacillus sp. JCM 10914 TaxID=1236974 RepID=UPI0003CC8179|nr:antibiotic biosynthesis monooxygenase [Paenibacillus sp. JCM 10914]GAE04950.1 antibiotic biosynthesis monooxygenase [Paenibacillus sp. JCM 10914]
MILETAALYIKPGLSSDFESAFRSASNVLLSKKGYVEHELHKCVEKRDEYVLLVRWKGIKDRLVGFKHHPDYTKWVAELEPFYARSPEVKHYIDIRTDSREQAELEMDEWFAHSEAERVETEGEA